MSILGQIAFLLCVVSGLPRSYAAEATVFECKSTFEGVHLNLKVHADKATATYSTGDGKSFTCSAVGSIHDLLASQISRFEGHFLFSQQCRPKLSANLSKLIAREMDLVVPVKKSKRPTLTWINYRKPQDCLVQKNEFDKVFAKSY